MILEIIIPVIIVKDIDYTKSFFGHEAKQSKLQVIINKLIEI